VSRSAVRSLNFFRSYPLASAGSWLAIFCALAAIVWYVSNDQTAAVARARSLVARLVPDARLTAEEYVIWKQISTSEPDVRLEVAKLFQQRRYAALLFESTELLGNTVIGLDQDGRMSREVAERLICGTLESDPGASNQAALLYLAPRLSPAGLDSAYCASVLSGRLLGANSATLSARARLLSRVLGRLPKETSGVHVAAIVNLMTSAAATDMGLLFSALQNVDSEEFSDEFDRALEALTMRISTAQSTVEVSDLFDSLDYLKFKVRPTRLALVIDAALDKMLVQNDVDLKVSIYATLFDLKTSHPETSFGARANYLMRGLHRFGDDVEMEDYSGVLRLNEQYGVDSGSEAALGSALLDAIRELEQRQYGSSINPYCQRFLEISSDLPYETLRRGARLLVEQLHNEAFMAQRECLHALALVERLEPSDRSELAAVVVTALEAASHSDEGGSLRRVADLIELLGLLAADLTEAQVNQVKAAIVVAIAMENAPDGLSLTNLAIAAVRVDLPPDFYADLFAMITKAAPAPSPGLSFLLEAFPDTQRSQLVAAELQSFFTLTEPADVAARVPVLHIMSGWIASDEQARIRESLIAAIDNTQDTSIVPTLATALATAPFNVFVYRSESQALKQAIFRKIAASTERSDLAALFAATRAPGLSRVSDADDRKVLRAAIARFLDQIVPPDGRDVTVRGVIKRFDVRLLPAEVEKLSGRFVQALGDERRYGPIANYAGSIQILALQAMPGQLDALLQELHAKLISTTDTEGYPLLLATWLAVEASTNQYLPLAQRSPLYDELLRLPLMSGEGRKLLQERIEEWR
jgi:hypothetical protein